MEEAVSTGRIAAPGFFADPAMRMAYLSAEWIGDAPLSLDPEKDANAAEKLIGLGISSIEDQTMQLTGKEWRTIHAQRVIEHKMRVEADLEPPVIGTTTVARVAEAVNAGSAPAGSTAAPATQPGNSGAQQDQQDGDQPDSEDQADKADQPDQPDTSAGKKGKN